MSKELELLERVSKITFLESLEGVPKITLEDISEKYTGKNKSDIINQHKLIQETDKLDAIIQAIISKMKYDRNI